MKKKLKLFIWDDFDPDWSSGLAVAIAEDEAEARELVIKERGYDPYSWGDLTVKRLDQRMAVCVGGGG